jgi:hypothetical protein
MENKEIIIEELNAVKEIRDICKNMTDVFDNELDTIENGLQELADTIAGLESKCALHDYWRDMAHRYGKILDILKKCPFVLDSIYRNTNNTEFSKRYQFGTIVDSELEIVKRWLEL